MKNIEQTCHSSFFLISRSIILLRFQPKNNTSSIGDDISISSTLEFDIHRICVLRPFSWPSNPKYFLVLMPTSPLGQGSSLVLKNTPWFHVKPLDFPLSWVTVCSPQYIRNLHVDKNYMLKLIHIFPSVNLIPSLNLKHKKKKTMFV